jgi:hypothetical protein
MHTDEYNCINRITSRSKAFRNLAAKRSYIISNLFSSTLSPSPGPRWAARNLLGISQNPQNAVQRDQFVGEITSRVGLHNDCCLPQGSLAETIKSRALSVLQFSSSIVHRQPQKRHDSLLIFLLQIPTSTRIDGDDITLSSAFQRAMEDVRKQDLCKIPQDQS